MTVYTDGRYAGTNSGKNQPVSFTLRPGTNVLAVRCLNLHGEAGILGSLSNALVTDSRWKCTGRGKRYETQKERFVEDLTETLNLTHLIFYWHLTCRLDCKTVRIFAYSSKREQSNKRSRTRLKTESEAGERRYGRVRLERFARVRLLRHALPISLLILRKKPTILQSTCKHDTALKIETLRFEDENNYEDEI